MSSHGIELLEGTFTGTGQSSSVQMWGVFNLFIYGSFTGTVRLERSFDGGLNWIPVSASQSGADASYSAPMSLPFQESEDGMLYRLNCTAHSAGTISYRISQGQYRLRF